jgi:serine phosphatase RsbU (regulator of sigma subunit)
MALDTNLSADFCGGGGRLEMCQMWQGTSPEQLDPGAQFVAERTEQEVDSSVDEHSEKIRALEEELEVLRREQSKLHRGIFEAAQIQRRLCAPRQLVSGEYEVAGEIFPVRHLSGDFFKVMELDSALGIVVGDIAGKGLSAGIWLPHLVSLIHRCARAHSDPADAISQANRELCSGYGEPPLVALFFARIDLESGEILYCNAGLPSPLIFGRDSDVTRLDEGGPMLGATSNGTFHTGIVTLCPGHTLIACSDGVTECQNSRDQEFELARLSAAARAAGGGNASQTLFSALGAVLDFADGCPLGDDLTLLVVRREQIGTRNSSTVMQEQVPVALSGAVRRQRLVS